MTSFSVTEYLFSQFSNKFILLFICRKFPCIVTWYHHTHVHINANFGDFKSIHEIYKRFCFFCYFFIKLCTVHTSYEEWIYIAASIYHSAGGIKYIFHFDWLATQNCFFTRTSQFLNKRHSKLKEKVVWSWDGTQVKKNWFE